LTSFVTVKETFRASELVINPYYIPTQHTKKQTCNVFTCDYTAPPQPPPPQPEPMPIIQEPPIEVKPTCPPEITVDDIYNYDLYTPAEQMVEERIAEKQQQLNDLEQRMQLSQNDYEQKQQAMEEAMRARQDSVREMDMVDAQRKNTTDPTQTIMSDISKRLLRIESKLNIMPV
jgi:hypothetical protein